MTALRIVFIPALWLMGITETFVKLSGRKFGACLAPAILISTLIMYFSQLTAGSFTPAVILLAAASVLFIPLCYVQKDKRVLKENFFSTGFYVFSAAVLVVFVMDYARTFYLWDELSHWGEMTKEMFRLDKFYNAEGTRLLVHLDYPPFLSVFELLFCRLAGRYSEMGCTAAVHLFELGMLMPLVEEIGKKIVGTLQRLVFGWLYTATMICLMVFMDTDATFSTIYKDIPIAMLFVYSMFLVMKGDLLDKKLEAVFFIVSLCSVILSKQMGIAYIMVALFYLVITILTSCERKNKRLWLLPVLSIAAVYVCNKTWKLKLLACGLTGGGQFDLGKISIRKYLSIAYGSKESALRDCFLRYLGSLFSRPVTIGSFSVSYIAVFAALILILTAGAMALRIDRKKTLCCALSICACTAGWAFTMSILYLFSFSESEMAVLASFGRYMGPIMMAQYILVLGFLCINGNKGGIGLKEMLIYFLACTVIMTPAGLYHMLPPFMRSEESTASYERMAKDIEERVPEGSSVLIAAMDNIKTQYYVNYYSDSISVDLFYTDMENGDYSDPEFSEKVTDRILENDYLFVNESSEDLINGLMPYNGGIVMESYTLFKVINNNGELCLVEQE